jgi:sugar (pentulose or hexulose) kinase
MIEKERHFLVVNLGLRSIRAIVFDANGDKLAADSHKLETRVSGDTVEQDPNRWWDLTVDIIRSVQNEVNADATGYLTVTSSSCNLVPVNRRNNPTYPSMLVSDKRSTEEASWFASHDDFADLLAANNFSASPSYIPSKVRWLRYHEPEVYDRTETFGTSNSYLTAQFVGRHVTDSLDAEKYYYTQEDGYPSMVLDALGVTTEQLPNVVPVGTDVGRINDDVADLLDLPRDARFIITTYDALAAFWGSGATEPGDGSNVCGTCSSLRVYADDETVFDLSGSTLKAQHFGRSGVTAVGGSNSLEGGILEWAKSTLYAADDEDDADLFDKMEAGAAAQPIGANGLIFLPYLLGERAPFDDPNARGVFFGLERKHEREDMIRSIFESIGYLTRHMIDAIEDAGQEVTQLKIAGGLTRRELACQIKADVTGRPVVLVDELENTALGCMIIMRSTVDSTGIEELSEDIVDEVRVFDPDPEAHVHYAERYDLFRDLYETNRALFKRRSDLLAEAGDTDDEFNL